MLQNLGVIIGIIAGCFTIGSYAVKGITVLSHRSQHAGMSLQQPQPGAPYQAYPANQSPFSGQQAQSGNSAPAQQASPMLPSASGSLGAQLQPVAPAWPAQQSMAPAASAGKTSRYRVIAHYPRLSRLSGALLLLFFIYDVVIASYHSDTFAIGSPGWTVLILVGGLAYWGLFGCSIYCIVKSFQLRRWGWVVWSILAAITLIPVLIFPTIFSLWGPRAMPQQAIGQPAAPYAPVPVPTQAPKLPPR